MGTQLKLIENELVPVYETSTGEKVVYGSELHKVLEVKTPYKDWSERRLHDVYAIESEDFEAAQICAPSGQNKKEHIIKLDTAKEMAMLERNDKGKQVRQYFIQIEKKYKNEHQLSIPKGKELLALAVIEAQKTIENQQSQIERMKPKEIFADAVSASNNSMLVRDVAKIINQNGVPLGEKRFYKWLRQNGFVCITDNSPTQKSMEMGLFEVVVKVIKRGNGKDIETRTSRITGKGQQYFINKFLEK